MAFKLKSGNKISFKNMGSSPAKQGLKRAKRPKKKDEVKTIQIPKEHIVEGKKNPFGGPVLKSPSEGGPKPGTGMIWNEEERIKAGKSKERQSNKYKKSPVKTTHKGEHTRKEELLDQGFTQEDADQMIESGATTGKVSVESYKDRMKRLSKKYNKSPEEIKEILESKDYKEGRTKKHSPMKHDLPGGEAHVHKGSFDVDTPESEFTKIDKTTYTKEDKKSIRKTKRADKKHAKAERKEDKRVEKYLKNLKKSKKKTRGKVKRTKRPKARKVKNLVTGGYNIIR
jgi:hypothetical protein